MRRALIGTNAAPAPANGERCENGKRNDHRQGNVSTKKGAASLRPPRLEPRRDYARAARNAAQSRRRHTPRMMASPE
jgi:hypothetical protein